METPNYYYYYVADLTKKHLKGMYKYTSFLIEVEDIYYQDGFYLIDVEEMLIRTTDKTSEVKAKLDEIKFKSRDEQNVPIIYYKLYDAAKCKCKHPEDESKLITGIELYKYFAEEHLKKTGIDFLKGEKPPKEYREKWKLKIENRKKELLKMKQRYEQELQNARTERDKSYFERSCKLVNSKIDNLLYDIYTEN